MIASALSLLGLALNFQVVAQAPSQRADAKPASASPVPAPTDTSATAVRAESAPSIDGKEDDAVWRIAPTIKAFQEWRPTEGKPARFPTEAKIAYDASNLYVFVRAIDPHPDSIIQLLERRDSFTASDMIWVFVDSYHDKRTGYEFGVNAAGVKLDQAIYDDGNEDGAWDAVWDVSTRIDSAGWTAEFRIPLSQMRYTRDRKHTFGIMIDRGVYRYSERYIWPLLRQSKTGFVSQFGSLHGIDDVEPPRKLEATPYLSTRNASRTVNNRYTTRTSADIGGDLKYRIAPNLTLDATINPDFGQVESDPSVLNLSAYESFFDERRPFFVAGRGLFRFDVNCNAVNCYGEGLYYSRRIGRTPQLAGAYGDSDPLEPVTILGAGKLLGRFSRGLTVGVLEAVTQRASSPGDTTYDPRTNYGVVRATQDFRGGNSAVGGIVTAVNRNMDQWSSPYLASSAYVGALDFRHRFLRNTYEISATLDKSRVEGSESAILSLQRNSVHQYQRPDADLPLDPDRTVLEGDAEELKLSKVAGAHVNFESSFQRRSPGFETNDLGFLRRSDQQNWSTWVGYSDRKQRYFYNRFNWNNNWWQYWTTEGLPLEAAYNTNLHVTFKNNWGWSMGGTAGQLGKTYDDRSARGGPAVRQDPYIAPWLFVNGDDRKLFVPNLSLNYFRGDDGRSSSINVGPGVDFKAFGQFSGSLSASWSHNISANQWYGNFDDAGVTHYTFAHLDQKTTAVTLRFNFTFTPDMSLQTYAQPFVSKGTYSNVRQLSATPRASDYDDRYAPYLNPSVTDDPGGFNFKALQSNVVYRWEYRPGSTLFLVWNHGRQRFDETEGDKNFSGDVRDLFRLHPANTFLVKVSYWLNR